MAGYSYVGQVTDPNAQKALKTAFDLIGALRSELDTLKAGALTNAASINANNQRLISLADPQSNSDAATAGYVKSYTAAQLESFKGQAGVDGTINTAAAQIVTVQNGLITRIA